MITPVGKVGRGCQEVQREGSLSAMLGSPYSLSSVVPKASVNGHLSRA